MECDNIDTKFLQRVLLLLSFVALLFSISTILNTYGKYFTSIDEKTNIKIARWKILINGNDIKNNSTATQTITPVFINNDNISDGVIAPHAVGYFDLIIDGSDADVSFKYDIETKVSEESSVKDLIVTGYSINNGDIIDCTIDDIISNNVALNQQDKLISIRIYIKWNDDENSTMTNIEDTSVTGMDAKMDVSLTFTQVIL